MKYFTDEEIEIINSSYGTATALKDVLKNMFNARNYPEVNLQKCLLMRITEYLNSVSKNT